MQLSFVVPVYNEAEVIGIFHENLIAHVEKITPRFEIIYVNDGSSDDTMAHLNLIAKKNKAVKVLNLSKNFGKEIALTAGIFHAQGDAIVMLDADGQHPPAMIKDFIKKWQNGSQIVIGIRNDQAHETIIKRVGSKLFYKAFNLITGQHLIPKSTDFRLISQEVQEEFIKLPEHHRITRGLIDWLGFERSYVSFDSPERLAGKSSYKTRALIQLAVNSFTSLSLKPLFFFGYIGAFITISSFLLGIFIIIEQVLLGDPIGLDFTGSAMLGILVSFLVGIVLLSQAILAVYISHIHEDAKRRPLFIVNYKKSLNIKEE